MIDPQPNMIIVKFDDELVEFPLSEDGTIFDGQAFESDYELENYQIIFALYDESTSSSKELVRYAFIDDGEEKPIKSLYESNQLHEFVKYIVENEL